MVNLKIYKPILVLLTLLYAALSVYWVILIVTGNMGDKIFGSTYGAMALAGGISGLIAAKSWGFFRSYFGKAIIFLSLGLLLSEFGQLAFTYLSIVGGDIPYPSIADIGFFGAIPMYIAGAFCLMKGLGVTTIVKKNPFKLVVGIVVPLIVLGVCYWAFLKGYDASGMSKLTVFFDFGYPLGQAIYVSLALIILLSLGKVLGGVMKWPVFLLLAAFILQYAADFNFLFQSHRGTWSNGGYGDFLYLSAYFIMGASLAVLGRALARGFSKGAQDGAA